MITCILSTMKSAEPLAPGLQDWVESGFVTIHMMAGQHKQVQSYQLCDKLYRTAYNWMMYLDGDEFLHAREKCVSIIIAAKLQNRL